MRCWPPRACLSFLGAWRVSGTVGAACSASAVPPPAPCRARARLLCMRCMRGPRRRVRAQRARAPCWRARGRSARATESTAVPSNARPAGARRHAARAAADRARAHQAAAVHRAAPGGRAGRCVGPRRAARRRPRAGARAPRRTLHGRQAYACACVCDAEGQSAAVHSAQRACVDGLRKEPRRPCRAALQVHLCPLMRLHSGGRGLGGGVQAACGSGEARAQD